MQMKTQQFQSKCKLYQANDFKKNASVQNALYSHNNILKTISNNKKQVAQCFGNTITFELNRGEISFKNQNEKVMERRERRTYHHKEKQKSVHINTRKEQMERI